MLASGTIKGLTNDQLEDLDCQIILGNTYHLALRPGADLLNSMGGLQKFMNWPRALLTDSGGFQMVCLQCLFPILMLTPGCMGFSRRCRLTSPVLLFCVKDFVINTGFYTSKTFLVDQA